MLLLSVIVPFYNVEKYLPDCLASLEAFPEDSVEILFVDDCGSDRSLERIEAWAGLKQNRFVLRREQNGGLSAARNTGLDRAAGEYVFFLDSDDIVDAKAVLETATEARERKLDVMKAGFCCFDDETGERTGGPQLPGTADLPGAQLFADECRAGIYEPMVWQCVYRRGYLRERSLRMTEGILFEDEVFQSAALTGAARAASCGRTLVFYRQREGSIMRSFSRDAGWCESYLYVCRFLSRLSEACTAPEAKEALRHRAGQIALSVARNIPAYGLQGTVREDATAFLKKHLEELTAFAMGSGSASLKAQGWLLRRAPSVYLGLYGGLRRLRARSKPR